ncbi:lef10 [Lambdina fiscellaria nucleopolyhedrovirus]|uniref:Lef10 n=1 Tax=Lambdina fiscellaria nucleopolyhedrovirus TaxID=1642929 RepID=A0A0E3Z7G4_9ABAC|nr:lef10 [Lambdina fiscellaria nucleopolyhedrovirus]AKC91718.1 lef10 [Lambdina fiscellaria nucleopolyhedrovirus]
MSIVCTNSDDILSVILNKNLELIDNTYIILYVVDGADGARADGNPRHKIQPMCLGEIGSFQTDQTPKNQSMSASSAASELQSD